jgi:LysR family transcriptional regulator, carnitine catabolism transcriptional activator
VLVFLAQTLSFSKTADHFHVSQPTLSKAVREIEDGIGARLFERTTRSVRLTVYGEALLPVARRLVSELDAGMTELGEVMRRQAHGLAIAALPTLAATILPELVAQLQREEPLAMIRVHDVVTDEAIDMLRARRVDLALTSIDVVHKDLTYTEIFREPFVLLTKAEHVPPFTQWDAHELTGIPVVTMPKGTGTRQTLDAAFLEDGLRFRPVMELRELNSIAQFILAGCGVSLLPRTAAELARRPGLIWHELVGAPERFVGIVTRREAGLSKLAAKMMKMIRTSAARAWAQP